MGRIMLPRHLNRGSINHLVNETLNEHEVIDNEITFDFSELKFIEPSGVTTLGNLVSWLEENESTVFFDVPDDSPFSNDAIKYLDDSGFFDAYLGERLFEGSSVRSTTTPLLSLNYSRTFSWLEFTFIPWLAGQLKVNTDSLGNVQMCIMEIFNNIENHSKMDLACIFAQHFPNRNKLTIAIADFGVGIPSNVRRVRPALDDAQSLSLAITDGFTTKTTPRNLGAGLHTLIKNVVNGTNGSVRIHSGYGILHSYCANDTIRHTSRCDEHFYKGTFIEVNIDTLALFREIESDNEEEFVW